MNKTYVNKIAMPVLLAMVLAGGVSHVWGTGRGNVIRSSEKAAKAAKAEKAARIADRETEESEKNAAEAQREKEENAQKKAAAAATHFDAPSKEEAVQKYPSGPFANVPRQHTAQPEAVATTPPKQPTTWEKFKQAIGMGKPLNKPVEIDAPISFKQVETPSTDEAAEMIRNATEEASKQPNKSAEENLSDNIKRASAIKDQDEDNPEYDKIIPDIQRLKDLAAEKAAAQAKEVAATPIEKPSETPVAATSVAKPEVVDVEPEAMRRALSGTPIEEPK